MQELNLPEPFRKNVRTFVESLEKLYGHDLISVILYGSAARGELTPASSNINLLVVLHSADLSSLEKSRNLLHKPSSHTIEPLFLTREYLLSSTDVFPIEFLDMKESCVCLHGEDILKTLEIRLDHLRFQCEQELKSKLLLIKQQYLRIDPRDKRALAKLLFHHFNSITHILRNLLRLKGKTQPLTKENIFKEMAVELRVETPALRKVWELKQRPDYLKADHLKPLFGEFVRELDQIVQAVDKL